MVLTTFTYIIGILAGAFITSFALYCLKLREEVKQQKKLIEQQHELIAALTVAAFRDKIQEHFCKKASDSEDNSENVKSDMNDCDHTA